MNIALILSYHGAAFHGWQIQKNGDSVQQTLTDAIDRLMQRQSAVSGVGRTDSGVHARRYVASVHAENTIPPERLPYALSSLLPDSVAVSGACLVPEAFDARFDCTRKEYAYYIFPSALRDPFLSGRAYRHPYPLNLALMQQGAARFEGTQDFAAVRSQGTPVRSTVRTVYWCRVEETKSGLLRIRVCGDGFLYNMVRAIAGTLLYVGSGKLTPDDVTAVLQSGDREQAGPTLPAQGLYMNRLWYEHTPELAPFHLDQEI